MAGFQRRPRSDRPARSALDAAMHILARRAHSQAELSQKLRQREYTAAEIEAALVRLAELALMEPEPVLAERYARELSGRRGVTPWVARQKLSARGLGGSLGEAAVRAAFADWDASAAAKRLIQGEKNRDRAARRLKRRGFAAEVIREILGQWPREAQEG